MKTMFKQTTRALRYKIVTDTTYSYYDFHNKRTMFPSHDTFIIKDEEIIFTCELDLPLLKINDSFFISELNQTVKIQEVCRASDNSIVYTVFDKIIEDEISHESYLKVLNFSEINNKYYELENDLLKLLDCNIFTLKSKIKTILSDMRCFRRKKCKENLQ